MASCLVFAYSSLAFAYSSGVGTGGGSSMDFDFFVYAAFGDELLQGLDGFEDAGGDAVELAQDGEVGAVWGVVFAVEHVVVADVFHLKEA